MCASIRRSTRAGQHGAQDVTGGIGPDGQAQLAQALAEHFDRTEGRLVHGLGRRRGGVAQRTLPSNQSRSPSSARQRYPLATER